MVPFTSNESFITKEVSRFTEETVSLKLILCKLTDKFEGS